WTLGCVPTRLCTRSASVYPAAPCHRPLRAINSQLFMASHRLTNRCSRRAMTNADSGHMCGSPLRLRRHLMTDEHDDRPKTTPPDFVRYLNVRSASGVSFAPDGRRLTFLTDITGIAEVWSVTVSPGTSQTPLSRGGALPWPEQ